ncbi:MAG: hypothetical protein LBT86_00615 [Deltaproteobacteria bacterium]|nr:hypothetical protein [Deltaproteobacteria bacterium]
MARAKNRLDKLLAEVDICLVAVVSNPRGKTARRLIVRRLEGGSIEDIIRLTGQRLKASHDDLRRALAGELSDFRSETRWKALGQSRSLEADISDMDRTLLSSLKPYQRNWSRSKLYPGLGLTGVARLLARIGQTWGLSRLLSV